MNFQALVLGLSTPLATLISVLQVDIYEQDKPTNTLMQQESFSPLKPIAKHALILLQLELMGNVSPMQDVQVLNRSLVEWLVFATHQIREFLLQFQESLLLAAMQKGQNI